MIDDAKEEVYTIHEDELLNFKFSSVCEFDAHMQLLSHNSSEISECMKSINDSVLKTFSETDEVCLHIRFKKSQVTQDIFEQVLTKFFAVMRYELYHKIKACWEKKQGEGSSYDSEAEE